VKLVAIISNSDSRLAKACDVVMELPLEKELCPFDMVPTTSTEIQMIFGDALAVALMQKKAFGLDDFAENHPAGRIGKRITLRVKDLMLKDQAIPLCHPEDKLVDILVPELSNKQCGCVLVVDDEGVLEGIFTDGDLRRALEKEGGKVLDLPMGKIMAESPRFIRPSELALAAMEEMEGDQKHPITVLPVVDDQNKVVGIIKMHDIVQSGL